MCIDVELWDSMQKDAWSQLSQKGDCCSALVKILVFLTETVAEEKDRNASEKLASGCIVNIIGDQAVYKLHIIYELDII